MYIKNINFERTGGFAGIRIAAKIEMDELPEDQKEEILELFDELNIEEISEKLSGKMPVPDGFVYSIIVESKEREYKIVAGESALPDKMQPMVELLEGIAKRQMRKKG